MAMELHHLESNSPKYGNAEYWKQESQKNLADVQRLMAENAELKRRCGELQWISVKESLPEPCQRVICLVFGYDCIYQQDGESFEDAVKRNKQKAHTNLGYYLNDPEGGDVGWYSDGYQMMVQPSYWMPLPPPPKEIKQ